MPTARDLLAAATAPDGRVYAIGGRQFFPSSTCCVLRTVEAYTPTSDRWAAAAPMPTAREGLAAATGRDGRIYALGGDNETGVLATVEAFTPGTGTWVTVAPMPTARTRLAAVTAADGRIYAIGGGSSTNQYLTTVEAYNPATNTWSAVAPMPTPRRLFAAAAGPNGRIYAIGGDDGKGTPGSLLATAELYDPAADRWATTAPMPTPRENLAAATGSDGRVYAIGGSRGSATTSAYTPTTDSWASVAAMGSPRIELAAAAGPDGRIYAIGGATADVGTTGNVEAFAPPASVGAPPDQRYFAQTGFRVDNDVIWDYFAHRGGAPTFGYPVSRTFTLQDFTVQFFQRRIVQLDQGGRPRELNLLDPGLLPYTGFNGSTVPAVDPAMTRQAPAVGSPGYDRAIVEFVLQHAPDTFDGQPVNFYQTFVNTVTCQTAFFGCGPSNLSNPSTQRVVALLNLEQWGVPTSRPTVDPNNHNFVYLRFQRGIMMYDASRQVTEGILLADELKAILTGQNLPADVAQESADSPFRDQYDPCGPHWVRDPGRLPDTDLTDAFAPE